MRQRSSNTGFPERDRVTQQPASTVERFLKLLIITVLTCAVNQFYAAGAVAASLLKAVSRADATTTLEITLEFDQVPAYRLTTSGRKIDLELAETVPAAPLPSPAIDARMIKMVSTVKVDRSVISFYFRYPPQKVNAEIDKAAARLRLDILLGNQLSVSAPELSPGPRTGTPAKPQSAGPVSPLAETPYAKNWLSFITDYESPLSLSLSPRLTLPPFPLAAILAPQTGTDHWLPEEIQTQGHDQRWALVAQMVLARIDQEQSEHFKERLVLTYAEAMVRAGEYRQPYYLLQRIMIQYPETLLADLADFLLIYQQGSRGDETNAYYELRDLVKKIKAQAPMPPAVNLLLAELALRTGRSNDAEQFLHAPDLIADPALSDLRSLRLADLLYAKRDKAKALTAYQELAARSSLPQDDPMSLANFSDALYEARLYAEAAKRYQLLSDLLNSKPGQDLARFRRSMAQLRIPGSERMVRLDLEEIHVAYPNTRGGIRALLKETDLDYLGKRLQPDAAARRYEQFAQQAYVEDLREEAAFKVALVRHLAGEHPESVSRLMELLRGFRNGRLRTEAQALLIEQLPGVIKQLVRDGEYIKALVLAKQNKRYFINGWLNNALLYDLAKAYIHLGMYSETAQTYQYLFDVAAEGEKEKIYLPMIQSLFGAGRHLQVEEYADRYLIRYPDGRHRAEIFELKVRAMAENGEGSKALQLLNDPRNPQLPRLELLKGRLYFAAGQWQKTIDTLSQPAVNDLLASQGMFMALAESHFQIGQFDQAATWFDRILSRDPESEQARFRLAQIERARNNRQQALKLFRELAEKGKDPLWSKLAREEMAIMELRDR